VRADLERLTVKTEIVQISVSWLSRNWTTVGVQSNSAD